MDKNVESVRTVLNIDYPIGMDSLEKLETFLCKPGEHNILGNIP